MLVAFTNLNGDMMMFLSGLMKGCSDICVTWLKSQHWLMIFGPGPGTYVSHDAARDICPRIYTHPPSAFSALPSTLCSHLCFLYDTL